MNWTPERLDEIAGALWTELTHWSKPDCCVLATRCFIDLMAALGEHNVFGFSVTAVLMDRSLSEHSVEHGCGFQAFQCEERPEDTVATVLGRDPDTIRHEGLHEFWSGHLAAVVQRRWIVDLSISQATTPPFRPELTGPLVMPANEALLRGRGSADLVTEEGVRIFYEGAPPDTSGWKSSPDWAWDEFRTPVVEATLARLRGQPYHYPEWMRAVRQLVGRV